MSAEFRDRVWRSTLDEQRFGFRVAKSAVGAPMNLIENFCRREAIALEITRVDVGDLEAIHSCERAGALLMDTLIAFERDLTGELPTWRPPADITLAQAVETDAPGVADVARKSFKDYVGHYHADPRLDPRACDEVYASWAVRSCLDRSVADTVLVARRDNRVVGFSALKVGAEQAEGTLDGVDPELQRQGVYAALSTARMHVAKEAGAKQILVTTHLANRAARSGLQRLGFELSWAQHTFHLWFDPATHAKGP